MSEIEGHATDLAADVQTRLNTLCKPPGSLGGLEDLAAQLCLTQRTLTPQTKPRHAAIFAADHGVTAEGVSAWPSAVTGLVVRQMANRKTASGVFADELGCSYEVVDVGLIEPLPCYEGAAVNQAQQRGTASLAASPAITLPQFQHAWQVGTQAATGALEAGARLLIGGEMGIGNTTSAVCMIALLADVTDGAQVDQMVGPGAGADDEQMIRKRAVIRQAIQRVQGLGPSHAETIACQVGGLEIVALAGYYAAASQSNCTVVVDGLIATSAALLANAIRPGCRQRMIAAHRSTEPAQQIALQHLQLKPMLDLQMRLGEATGALAALPLMDLASAMICRMATLDEMQA